MERSGVLSSRIVRGMRLILAGTLLVAGPTLGLTAEEAKPEEPKKVERPKYNPNQPDKENWKPPAGQDRWQTGDIFDPIKYIPLTDDGWAWASFGGQARLRFEAWNNFNTNEVRDDAFLLTRIRLHSDVHLGEHLRFFAEGISATSTLHDPADFRANGTLDVNTIDLQQAFGDVILPFGDKKDKVTIRGGRQELLLGKQRLVSPLDWANTRRTFEGVKATVDIGDWSVAGFWTQFVPVDRYDFDHADSDQKFWGVYATGKNPFIPDSSIDLYYLGRDRGELLLPPPAPPGTRIGYETHTAGGRLWGKIGKTGLDYDLEGAYQFGDRNFVDVDAYMVSTEIGYSFADAPGKPRIFGGFDYASGDNDPTDDSFETFDQLFPLGHAYFGFIDLVGRQNIMAWTGGVTFTPIDKLNVLVQGHVFELAEEESPLFNAGGGLVPRISAKPTDDIGSEIDLLLKYQWDMHTQLQLGYSHFFAGDYFEGKGHDDIDFLYFIWEYTF